MIAYDLTCCQGHTFEGWFEDARAFQTQKKRGLVTCPVCSSAEIARIPSTFAIKNRPSLNRPPLEDAKINMENLGRQIQDYVEKNFDDVGSDFAKEALKIHYGAEKPRNIRGVSTKQEEETLRSEGVDFIKVPLPAATKDKT
ncbi:MAG: DUF1178 family protein [Desulfobacterales bacterium]|nr:DUF1178 family protein [Desulfobacterales bacterium]MDJ0854134.1 DUF1178 family protein [Desulfobacterales bacterium]MDJ0888464.1 DUF1178 family protein [Desulfobacterales bacterium]MDJ0991285.1 DUF1178 family protein [Desulfobacterales bacterium]